MITLDSAKRSDLGRRSLAGGDHEGARGRRCQQQACAHRGRDERQRARCEGDGLGYRKVRFAASPRTGPRCSRCWRSHTCISPAGHLRPPDDTRPSAPPVAVAGGFDKENVRLSRERSHRRVDQSFPRRSHQSINPESAKDFITLSVSGLSPKQYLR